MPFSIRRFALLPAVAIAFASCAPTGSGLSSGALTPSTSNAALRPSKAMPPLIYVANEAGKPNGGTVTVYTTAGAWMRTMHKGIKAPAALAFDKLHDVYVLNAPAKGGGSVAVFSRGGKKLLGIIKSAAIKSPTKLALDSNNNIYVLNAASASTGRGNLLVFKAGTARLVATISKGISQPTDLTSDCNGNVYVLNGGSHTVTAYGPKHKLNRTIRGMTSSTGLMVTCSGNVYVSQRVAAAPVKPGVPLSATPSPSPSPSATPTTGPPLGTVTEFAAGSTTAAITIPLTQGVPCDMAANTSGTMIWVMACPAFTSSTQMSMVAYMENSTTPILSINTGITFDLFAYSVGVVQTTLAIPRTAPTSAGRREHSGSYAAGQLLVYGIGYAGSSAASYTSPVVVDESTMGTPDAIVAN